MKYVILSDIHFGHKGNSDEFNKQCLDFLDFVEKTVENRTDINGAIFCGDWFHTRNNINVKTLQAGVEGMFKLGNIGGGNSFMIVGNHDLYLKNSREIHSLVIPEGEIGVNVITEPVMLFDTGILLCPWLLEEENLKSLIAKHNPTYVCGHFEFPSFPLNSVSKFDGEFHPEDYVGPKRIISGHFHKRSEKNNITYIGNCFSHDFSDTNDWENKGFAILDTETNEIEYYEWKDAPKYCTTKMSQFKDIKFGSNMHIKFINDMNLKPSQVQEFKETVEKMPQIVDCMVYPQELVSDTVVETQNIENIDNIDVLITELLSTMDMQNISNEKLVKIYKELGE